MNSKVINTVPFISILLTLAVSPIFGINAKSMLFGILDPVFFTYRHENELLIIGFSLIVLSMYPMLRSYTFARQCLCYLAVIFLCLLELNFFLQIYNGRLSFIDLAMIAIFTSLFLCLIWDAKPLKAFLDLSFVSLLCAIPSSYYIAAISVGNA